MAILFSISQYVTGQMLFRKTNLRIDQPMRSSSKSPLSFAIIGGGFCGVMTAVNLARLAKRALHLTIINGHRPTGRGIAYGTRRPEHLLNVAARNMSAFPD